jgi:hypothetical protein
MQTVKTMFLAPFLFPVLALAATNSNQSSWTPWILEERDYSAFVGAGPALTFPQFRLGIGNWEGGILTSKSLGIDRVFRSGSTYAAFGLVGHKGPPDGGGLYGAVGFEFGFLKYLSLRGELNAIGTSDGFVRGEATLGLGLHVHVGDSKK